MNWIEILLANAVAGCCVFGVAARYIYKATKVRAEAKKAKLTSEETQIEIAEAIRELTAMLVTETGQDCDCPACGARFGGGWQ